MYKRDLFRMPAHSMTASAELKENADDCQLNPSSASAFDTCRHNYDV